MNTVRLNIATLRIIIFVLILIPNNAIDFFFVFPDSIRFGLIVMHNVHKIIALEIGIFVVTFMFCVAYCLLWSLWPLLSTVAQECSLFKS